MTTPLIFTYDSDFVASARDHLGQETELGREKQLEEVQGDVIQQTNVRFLLKVIDTKRSQIRH